MDFDFNLESNVDEVMSKDATALDVVTGSMQKADAVSKSLDRSMGGINTSGLQAALRGAGNELGRVNAASSQTERAAAGLASHLVAEGDAARGADTQLARLDGELARHNAVVAKDPTSHATQSLDAYAGSAKGAGAASAAAGQSGL